ncbi:hypothetical protein M0811_04226 [Anaeramoeba ignava]|uniref:Uncharacterized protein n=1 Tax=Anaeramoeba ignava TaxID=1746090 RepID=A0A9Q0LXP1_ANAIG|nr:hypothetical protein M0811_04226 [Anaeramoeba ignava]
MHKFVNVNTNQNQLPITNKLNCHQLPINCGKLLIQLIENKIIQPNHVQSPPKLLNCPNNHTNHKSPINNKLSNYHHQFDQLLITSQITTKPISNFKSQIPTQLPPINQFRLQKLPPINTTNYKLITKSNK